MPWKIRIFDFVNKLVAYLGFDHEVTDFDCKVAGEGRCGQKLKNLKKGYQKAIDDNRKSGGGKVSKINFDLLDQLFAGNLTVEPLNVGVETTDLGGEETDDEFVDVETEDGQGPSGLRSATPPRPKKTPRPNSTPPRLTTADQTPLAPIDERCSARREKLGK